MKLPSTFASCSARVPNKPHRSKHTYHRTIWMNLLRIYSLCIVAALLAISIAVAFNNAAALQRGPPSSQPGVEVLTRGPVHEAFAETVTFDPQPGVVVPKAPPA